MLVPPLPHPTSRSKGEQKDPNSPHYHPQPLQFLAPKSPAAFTDAESSCSPRCYTHLIVIIVSRCSLHPHQICDCILYLPSPLEPTFSSCKNTCNLDPGFVTTLCLPTPQTLMPSWQMSLCPGLGAMVILKALDSASVVTQCTPGSLKSLPLWPSVVIFPRSQHCWCDIYAHAPDLVPRGTPSAMTSPKGKRVGNPRRFCYHGCQEPLLPSRTHTALASKDPYSFLQG